MRRQLAPLAIVAVVAALTLGACGGGDGEFDFGKPGEPSEADRTVEVRQRPGLRFDPTSISVEQGETVTFRIVNEDEVLHEFDLGDQEFQDSMMKQMEGMKPGERMADEPNAISVKAGETRELTWTFSEKGTFQYACHQPGHHGAGMMGTVIVS